MRIGHGYDVHRLAEGRRLILGGVVNPGELGLLGHWEGVVRGPGVMDALLGAAGLGDIGGFFPDSDPAFAGVSSLLLLDRVMERLAAAGLRVGNVDATILAQQPRMAPHIPRMRENLAAHMGVDPARVNIKATTEEGLGFTGTGEGIAAHGVCLLEECG